jgi:protein-S-isoprenylcysteine O-methyltransferase Ste14
MSQWAVDISELDLGDMQKNLRARGARRLVVTFAALAFLLFVPAGSLRFWQAWAFLAVMGMLWTYFFVDLLRHDPQLLERRMRSKESEPVQKLLLKIFSAALYVGFVTAGLDFRFGWSQLRFGGVPIGTVAAAQLAGALAYWLVFLVMRANSFAGSTIEVEKGQTVIASGPYTWVRHPMYLGMAVSALAAPLALGSFVAVPVFVLIVPVLMARLMQEEKTLQRQLTGYTEYCARTRFRLVPWIW